MKMTMTDFRILTGRCIGCGREQERHNCEGTWHTASIIRFMEEVTERARDEQRADTAEYINQALRDGQPIDPIIEELRIANVSASRPAEVLGAEGGASVEGTTPGDDGR